MFRSVARWIAAFVVVLLTLSLTAPADALTAPTGELIFIDSVQVGSPVMSTLDSCNGLMNFDNPVVPLTIKATIIPPPGEKPVGPYATGEWSAGYGSWEDHFATAQAHSPSQTFHILLHADQWNGWHGAGIYTVYATVQDVGLAGGFATKDVQVSVPPLSPSTAKVKCDMAKPISPGQLLGDMALSAAKKVAGIVCLACKIGLAGLKAVQGVLTYNAILNHYMYGVVEKDPPDNDFQQIATASPPPVLPAPAELPDDQKAALIQLEQTYSDAIGQMRALYVTVDRIWGADNAADRFWYLKQLRASADLASQASTDLAAMPALWTALHNKIGSDLPDFTVTQRDVIDTSLGLFDGLPDDIAGDATALGEGPAVQQQTASELTLIDPDQAPASTDGKAALFGQNTGDLAQGMHAYADWADDSADAQPPVVTDVSPSTIPASGWRLITIKGANLGSVTGINFGPSDLTGGAGWIRSCSENECTAFTPPGKGTVDVTAVGPGGPSQPGPGDQLTYRPSSTPQITRIFPSTSPKSGGTSVTIFGTGLSNATPYFGPTAAASWTCTDTSCSAEAPPSASADTVDLTAVTAAGTSTTSAADKFTYTDSAPPPAAPVIAGVSPDHGTNLGGDTVTITGANFTDASGVDFGDFNSGEDMTVVDDSHIEVTTPSGDPGPVDVRVSGPGGQSATTADDTFTYDPDTKPVIAKVTPDTGSDIGGTKVTITGHDLTDGQVFFDDGGYEADDAICGSTTCTLTAPPHPDGTVDITVDTRNGYSKTSSAAQFTYTPGPQPTITGLSPDAGPVDGKNTVVVFGTNLAGGSVRFGGLESDPADIGGDYACSMTACIVAAPPGTAGRTDVTVKTAAGTSATNADTKYSYQNLPKPVVDSVSPNLGWIDDGDAQVKITGHDLSNGTVYFGNTPGYSTCTQTECTVGAPNMTKPKTVAVTVTTSGGTSEPTPATTYTFRQPTITTISPKTAWTHTDGPEVTIKGTDLSDGTVLFGDTGANDSTCTDTQCTATAPWTSTAGTVDVQVRGGGHALSPKVAADEFTFKVRSIPTVTGVSPAQGSDQGSDQITVTGTDLSGGNVVFGTAGAAQSSCDTDTKCTATTPKHGDGTVDVTVQTHVGISATNRADQFTFVAPVAPAITQVSPNTGSTAGGTAVTITGTNLVGGQVSFGGATGKNTACTKTQCTAAAPPHAAAEVDISVTTPGGTSPLSNADKYSYVVPPAPRITGVSPDAGPASGASTITITGTDLAGAAVSFGEVAATDVSCTDTSCFVAQPPHATGKVDVRVTTDGGTSSVVTADQFNYQPVTLSEHAVPGANAATGGGAIVRGTGGDMWFAMPKLDEIGRIDSSGTITTYKTPAGSGPIGIAKGPDGRMWFTEQTTNKIVAIDNDGNQTEYHVPGQPSDIRFLTTGPDGRIWFSLGASGAIGAMTTDGAVTIYHLPDPTVFPYTLVSGPDGRLWFTEVLGNAIGTITTDGTVHQYPIPDSDAESWGLTLGGDGRMWFAEEAGRALGAISMSGTVTMYPLPAQYTNPEGITYGPDGRMWFAAPDVDQLTALDPNTGTLTDYPLPNGPGSEQPRYLAMDAHGALWVTEFGGKNVAKIDQLTAPVKPTVGAVLPGYGHAGDTVTITGSNLADTTAVHFGSQPATFSIDDPGHITANVPSGSGTAAVTVTTPHGTSGSAPFHYGVAPPRPPVVTDVHPDTGSTAGGTSVTIDGTDLSGATVSFGSLAATGVACTAASCTATSPAGSVGTVDVTVTTAGGTSDTSSADQFTYLKPKPAVPMVTGVNPASGPVGGGTTVTITGAQLTDGAVSFGMDTAAATCAATSCTVTAPPGGVGTVDVRVSTDGGNSAVVATDQFSYTPAAKAVTTTTVSISPASAKLGDTVTYTAHVTSNASSHPTGSVTFTVGDLTMCTTGPLVSGTASCQSGYAPGGTDTVTGTYNGDNDHAGSVGTSKITIGPGKATLNVRVSLGSVAQGTKVMYIVSASATVGRPTGKVAFTVGSVKLCTATLSSGYGSCNSTAAPVGTDTVKASYSGDKQFVASAATTKLTVTGSVAKPTAKLTTPAKPFQLSRSISVRYSGTGKTYDVQYRAAKWNGGFGSYRALATGTSARHASLKGKPGYEYCFRVRAHLSSASSGWTAHRCTTIPLDDRALKATTSGWKRAKSTKAYDGTLSTTSKAGAKLQLSNAQADRLALVVTTCKACGRVGAYVNGKLWKTVNTRSSATHRRVIVVPGKFTMKKATIVLRTMTKHKSVMIDGLGIART